MISTSNCFYFITLLNTKIVVNETEVICMNFAAKRIKTLLCERGWSEYRLAVESNLSQSTISNIFTRDTIPSIPTLETICKALGISLAQFFTQEEEAYLLTPEEQKLLKEWASLTEPQKLAIFSIIKSYRS